MLQDNINYERFDLKGKKKISRKTKMFIKNTALNITLLEYLNLLFI